MKDKKYPKYFNRRSNIENFDNTPAELLDYYWLVDDLIAYEGNFYQFDYNGRACFILRNKNGAWCGYVEVYQGSIFYDSDWSNANGLIKDFEREITFSGTVSERAANKYNLPDKLWFIGFDLDGLYDYTPGYNRGWCPKMTYKTKSIAIELTKMLAEEVDKIEG